MPLAASGRGQHADEDALLVRRMAEGDPHGLGALYDRHSVSIYSHVLPLVGSPADAEEVVEDTFWGAWRNSRGYEPELFSVSAWLVSMARRRAVERRKAKNRAPAAASPKESDAAPSVAALDKLPEGQRDALSLAFLGAMSYEEIAKELEMKVGTVAYSIRSGMQAVGAHLRPPVADIPAVTGDEE